MSLNIVFLKLTILIVLQLLSNLSFSQLNNNINQESVIILDSTFAQSHPQNAVLIRQIEGVNFSYSFSEDNSNCIFYISNSSNNSVKITWDVKLFFSNENDSKEIHKEFTALPQTDIKIDAVNKTKVLDISQSSETKGISNIEIHNVKFKAVQ